ncbi:hypothetical protein V6U77_22190 [Micromonospora sp. CPCC 205546]|uniref:hypothetical protein n=1 Tax=Micromonospora sp. CPCC 205546 TaxID=3122397 RepID=UPI002FF16473
MSAAAMADDPSDDLAAPTGILRGGPARRRGGAGRAAGVDRIRLDTRGDLVEARALYARHGYREIPAYHDGPYAEHWFEKVLS